ncbi:MAG: carbohydrate porin, partial [Acetobacter okinawensis]
MQSCPKRKSRTFSKTIFVSLALSLLSTTASFAQNAETQLEQDRRRLGNSGPLVSEIDPATVRDSMRAAEAAKSPDADHPDLSDHLLGSVWGARDWMARHGITLDIQEVDELWGNTTGGNPSGNDGPNGSGSGTGPAYDGMTMPTLTVDLEKLIGLKGGLFNISALQLRGRSISQDHLSVYNPVSGFEADRSTRLFELWYQQSFLGGKLDIKIGQQDLDTEFLISDYGSLYLNSNFGWPMAPSVNLYAGGPSWPLASPAVRIRYRPTDQFTVMFAAADDNPPGNTSNSFGIQGGNPVDPTNQNANGNASGTKFNMGTGALLMTELQYAINPQPDDMSKVTKDPGLPGVYKLGGFYDTGRFPDYRYNQSGQALGGPDDTTGIPRWDRGNWMVYGIVDQMLWRPSLQSAQSVGVFARATGNGGDRNMISYAVDAGVNLKAPFKGRDNDTVGVGWGLGRASYGQRQYDRNVNSTGTPTLTQGTENHLEVTYQAQVMPWWVMQPDFQYIWNPSGGVYDSRYSTKRVGNEAVFGLHSSIT